MSEAGFFSREELKARKEIVNGNLCGPGELCERMSKFYDSFMKSNELLEKLKTELNV